MASHPSGPAASATVQAQGPSLLIECKRYPALVPKSALADNTKPPAIASARPMRYRERMQQCMILNTLWVLIISMTQLLKLLPLLSRGGIDALAHCHHLVKR
jgi:hypothetical protein